MNAKERLAAKMKLHNPERSEDDIWKEILVMPWVDRLQLYADLSVAESRAQFLSMTGTQSNQLATILIDCAASLPQPSAGHQPIRWNLGTCEKDKTRPHLINDNHICREWKKSPSAGQTEGK